MALTYEEARRQAEVCVDAFNRRDPDPIVAMLHEEVAHRGPFVADRLGHERDPLEGREAQREFLRWLWAKEPRLRHVLEEVFVGSDGYAFLTRSEHDGTRYVFVNQVDADGVVRHFHVYHGPLPGP
jgi:nuclear transport factor 2 (NTF2) superfamily protein